MARRVTLQNEYGRVLGYQEERDGKIFLYDVSRRELGWYDIRKNETWQSYPRKMIAKSGDLLALLLEKKY